MFSLKYSLTAALTLCALATSQPANAEDTAFEWALKKADSTVTSTHNDAFDTAIAEEGCALMGSLNTQGFELNLVTENGVPQPPFVSQEAPLHFIRCNDGAEFRLKQASGMLIYQANGGIRYSGSYIREGGLDQMIDGFPARIHKSFAKSLNTYHSQIQWEKKPGWQYSILVYNDESEEAAEADALALMKRFAPYF